jgi:hypothetical protein
LNNLKALNADEEKYVEHVQLRNKLLGKVCVLFLDPKVQW